MTATKISIVTPSFNQVAFIEKTITSVLGQQYPNLEYVIIDGGSTDGSDAIIMKHRPQLHYYISEPDSGHGNALNKGFRQTTGEIMAWLNSDDMYLPWTFKTVSEIFDNNPDIHWIAGTQGFFNDRGTLIYAREIHKNIVDFLDGDFGWIQQESVFWRRGLWERAGGRIDESYRFMVDGELWCRFFALENLWHVSGIFGGYRLHNHNRAANHRAECEQEMRRAIADLSPRIDRSKLTLFQRNYLVLRYDTPKREWAKAIVTRQQ